MFIDLPPSHHEAIHNLINLHLFPDRVFRLGQSDRYIFRDAEIVLERTGNLYSSGRNAMTYRFNIDAFGYSICLLAIWRDEDQATADVHVVALTPDNDDTRTALGEWLVNVVDVRMPPRDLFEGLRLQ